MKKNSGPAYALRDNNGVVETSLLDRVLENGEKSLKAQGINLDPKKESPEASTCWETIDALNNALRGGIMKAVTEINQAWASLDGKRYSNVGEVNLLVNTTNNDLDSFADKVLAIASRHAGKTGSVLSGPDLALSLGISSDYIMLGEELKALTFPTLLALTEAVNEVMRDEATQQS